MDVEAAVDELYDLPLEDFVAARDALARQVRVDGDRATSADVRALAKPTTAAWWANQLARQRSDDIERLLVLGDELRAAMASADRQQMRTLSPQRQVVVQELLGAAHELSSATGRRLSGDVADKLRETLDAAVVDPAAGQAVRTGRLSQSLRHVGFGVVDENGEPANVVSLTAVRAARTRTSAGSASEAAGAVEAVDAVEEKARQRREQAQRRVRETEAALADADARVDELAGNLDELTSSVDDAEGRITALRAELEAAEDALARAREAERRGHRRLEEARRASADARRVLETAREELDATQR
ncbi:MAG TPA: hypothetical protein VIP77_17260 [Jiangellaceae bacterium]